MIADLKPYSEYKDSGLPWLGWVPAHWDVLPHRALFEEVKEREHPNEQMLSVTITRGIIKQRDLLAGSSKKDSSKKDKSAYKLVCPGDIAYNKMRAWQGAIGVSDLRGIISPAYVVQRMRGAHNPRYFHHLFRTPGFAKEAESWSYGITSDMWSLRPEHFKAIYSPLPPNEEQAAIVRFLDHATQRLDKAIRAKHKTIALLNEQKQAIIHRAVTRGLDPDAPLKDSGIPWLGDIPQHWSLSPNRAFLRIRKILVGERHPQFQLLSLTKRGVIVRDLSEMRGKFSADMGTSQEVRSGDLVFCLFDVPETPRTVGLSQHDGMITGAYTVMECADQEMAKFLELFYIAMDDHKLLSPIYSGLRNTIPKDRFLGAKTPIPPATERAAILSTIGTDTAALNLSISRLEREIELLREYRTRLIADVVTGKLDVREAAARLPQVKDAPADEPDLAEMEESGEELAEENI